MKKRNLILIKLILYSIGGIIVYHHTDSFPTLYTLIMSFGLTIEILFIDLDN